MILGMSASRIILESSTTLVPSMSLSSLEEVVNVLVAGEDIFLLQGRNGWKDRSAVFFYTFQAVKDFPDKFF
jgi:hypothetical protein